MATNSNISILLSGNEVRDGRIADKNLSFLARTCLDAGYRVARTVVVGDEREELLSTLEWLSGFSDLIVMTGGLGPTEDDLTRDVAAEFSGRELYKDEAVAAALKKRFESLGRRFDKSNLKQALFPVDCELINNPSGTASGFLCRKSDTLLACLPGVPGEIREMAPGLLAMLESEELSRDTKNSLSLSTIGVPESTASGVLSDLELPSDVELSFTFSFPCVFVRFESDTSDLSELGKKAEKRLGSENVYATEEQMLDVSFLNMLRELKLTVAGAESCTGGLIGKLLTDQAGSSDVFLGSAVTYSNEAKQTVLGVKSDTLAEHGAVSAQTAIEMAIGAARAYESDISYSVTGIAGPGGGSAEKPVGLFYLGLCHKNVARAFKFQYSVPSRERIRLYAAYSCFDLIRRFLAGFPCKKAVLEREYLPQ